MRIILCVLILFLASCGGGKQGDSVANVTATSGSTVSVNFSGENVVDQETLNVTQNCLTCCSKDKIDYECLGSLDVSCAPEDFIGSACEVEQEEEM